MANMAQYTTQNVKLTGASLDSFCLSRLSDGEHVQLTKCFYDYVIKSFIFTDKYRLALQTAHFTAFHIQHNHAHNQQTTAAVCSEHISMSSHPVLVI